MPERLMRNEWAFPNRATPLGSSAYYSIRFSPARLRDDLAALLAWRHEVRAILDRVSDPGVARLKLQWWREELERSYGGEPRHPLSKVLQPVLKRHGLPAAGFERMSDEVEREILHRQPTDEAALDAACKRDQGALFELLARCHGLTDADSLDAARRLGGFCARVYLIRDSGALLRRGRSFLPGDLLQAQGVSAESLARAEHRDGLPRLLARAAEQGRAALAEIDISPGLPICTRVRGVILKALLEELERAGYELADQRIGLTPLRKLWLAWRESRR
ncbi:MAG: squalene/phytoene synthase family protein [Pseudomonadota bacterium]|nr:squalene/phytoene synthase family protein [Pseudomonadota bacterium]